MKRQRYRKESLQRGIVRGLSILAVCLILVLGAIVGGQLIHSRIAELQRSAYVYTQAAADLIDGDRIETYLTTGEKDEYYEEIQEILSKYLTHSKLKYYYVFVPFEDDLVYIWDAYDEVAKEEVCELGQHEGYMKNGKVRVQEIYRHDPPQKLSFENDETYGYIASAYSPIFNSEGEPVAVVGADVYFPKIRKELIAAVSMVVVSIILIILGATVVILYDFRKKLVKPIAQLNDVSQKMVDNLESDSQLAIDIKTGNEIEELGTSFEQMYEEIKDYIRRLSSVTAEKERIGTELDIANRIQASMLPCIFPPFPDREEFEIFASMNPAKEVGGDFYDFFLVDQDHLAIVVADVSGKGVPAALFMVIGKTLIKDHTTTGRDLGEVFTKVNDLLCESNSEDLFITAFVGVLNLKTGHFRYVNAGHETPFIAKKGDSFAPYKVKAAFVLAGMEGVKYKAGEMTLSPGDKIFQYTDGVPEATSADLTLFGMERLEMTLAGLSKEAPAAVLHGVQAEVDRFVGDAPQFDDITMLCLEYKGPAGEEKKK